MSADPNTTKALLEALHRAWQANQDMRLGQLVVNAAGLKEPQPGVFYVEDAQLLAGLEKLADRVSEKDL